MSANAGTTESNTKSDSSQFGNTTQNTSATFGPQGQQVLGSLQGSTTNPSNSANALTTGVGTLTNAANSGSALPNYQQNPYVTSALGSSNALASQLMQQGEAGMRSEGYTGGNAQNLNNQGNYAANFANQQALQNAQTQLGQYNTANSNAMTGASGLVGASQGQENLATQLLALLRGTNTIGTSEQVNAANSTTLGAGQSAGFNL